MNSIDPFKKTPNRIRELIDLSNKTLREISQETNINYETLSAYKRQVRYPKKENAKILADYFEVSVPYLLGLDDNSTSIHPKKTGKGASLLTVFEQIENSLDKGYFSTLEQLEEISKKTLFSSPTRDRLEEIKQEKFDLNKKIEQLDLESKELRIKLDDEIKQRLQTLEQLNK